MYICISISIRIGSAYDTVVVIFRLIYTHLYRHIVVVIKIHIDMDMSIYRYITISIRVQRSCDIVLASLYIHRCISISIEAYPDMFL